MRFKKNLIVAISAALMSIMAFAGLSSSTPASASPGQVCAVVQEPVASAAISAPHVTYIVKGSSATVTYGKVGNSRGKSSMNVSQALDNAQAFNLITMLNKPGKSTVEILINGKKVAEATATTNQSVAALTVSRNFKTGGWIATISHGNV